MIKLPRDDTKHSAPLNGGFTVGITRRLHVLEGHFFSFVFFSPPSLLLSTDPKQELKGCSGVFLFFFYRQQREEQSMSQQY